MATLKIGTKVRIKYQNELGPRIYNKWSWYYNVGDGIFTSHDTKYCGKETYIRGVNGAGTKYLLEGCKDPDGWVNWFTPESFDVIE